MSEEQIKYDIAKPSADTTRYAGFWMRFWAYLADMVIVFSINGILLSPLNFINGGKPIGIAYWSLAGIISVLVLYLYFLLMTKYYGQTLGKMIFGLKVIRKDLQPLQWSDIVFRELVGRFFYRVLFIAQLLYIVVAFDDKKQGIHDMISDTRVIHQ
ncbi:RDD family protein [Oceanobacillus sp. 143]|uniref:RDD family protein n=1 Tax=Oceanobacillus zhaokaii TaxID=2052660 RepID=A0A345PIT1_9BACI|nr:RDD family protein [Oceanobacillus zhaokaii]AXI09911.1 RDD family protein [Oceanobacillus zhaokaii]QGS69124.1 RDD family protein [Oceanobacillus sp. 143]